MNSATNSIYGVKTAVESGGQFGTSKTGTHAQVHVREDATDTGIGHLITSALHNDQFASLVLGGLGMILLMRRFIVYFALALTSGYLLYRGLGCQNHLEKYGSRVSDSSRKSVPTDRVYHHSVASGSMETPALENDEDLVEEALRETFPASDPPASW